jgi:hypothetical protein
MPDRVTKPWQRPALWLALGLLAALAATILLGGWMLAQAVNADFSIQVNGEPLHLPELHGWQWLLAWGGALLGVLLLPLLLLLVLALGCLGVLLSVGAALGAVALVLLIALSPLWLMLLLLLWWLLRRKPNSAGTMRR